MSSTVNNKCISAFVHTSVLWRYVDTFLNAYKAVGLEQKGKYFWSQALTHRRAHTRKGTTYSSINSWFGFFFHHHVLMKCRACINGLLNETETSATHCMEFVSVYIVNTKPRW